MYAEQEERMRKKAKNHVFLGILAIFCLISILSVSLTACNNPVSNNTKKPVEYTLSIGMVEGGELDAVPDATIKKPAKVKAGDKIILHVEYDPDYRQAPVWDIVDSDGNDAGITLEEGDEPGSFIFIMPEKDIIINVSFEMLEGIDSYTINVDPNVSGGALQVNKATAAEGESVRITVIPNTRYVLIEDTLLVTTDSDEIISIAGSAIKNRYTFVMPAEHVTVTAEFERDSTPIGDGDADGDGDGDNDGDSDGDGDGDGDKPGTPQVPENPVFPAIPGVSGWPITITNESIYGTVSANKDLANTGDPVVLTVVPSEGYRLGSLSIIGGYNPVEYTILGNDTCAFEMPNAAVKISANFATRGFTLHSITIDATANGAIVADPAEIQRETAPVTLSTEAASGYKINPATIKVTSGGQNIPIVQNDEVTFTFAMPAGDATVTGTFVAQSTVLQTITVNAAANGVIGVPLAAPSASTVELVLIPNKGYRYKEGSLTVSGVTAPTLSGDSIRKGSFTMPASAVTIGAQFEEIPSYAVNVTVKGVSSQGAFTVIPYVDGKKAVQVGETAILILNIPNRFEYRYKPASFAITGASATERFAGRIWTFTMPNQEVSAEAEVELIPSATVTPGNMTNGTVVIVGLKPDGTAPLGSTITLQGLPNLGYQINGAPTVTPQVTLTPDGPNKWRFTMGAAPLTVTMNFQALGNLVFYRGGLNQSLNITTSGVSEWGSYSTFAGDNVELNAETEGYNGNTRAIRITRPTGGPGSSRGEVGFSFNVGTAINLRASNVKALSFWIKDSRSAENRFEFYGVGNVNNDGQKSVRTRNNPDNTSTKAGEWKQFIVPMPPMTHEYAVTRVFFIKFDMDSGDSLLMDNVEFITDYVTNPTTRTGITIPGPNYTTIPTYALVYEGHATHADSMIIDGSGVQIGIHVRMDDW